MPGIVKIAGYLLVVGVLIALGLIAQNAVQGRRLDDQCRLRLRRLAEALNQWVEDRGERSFPDIRNPPGQRPPESGRSDSSLQVLSPYLLGDLPLLGRTGAGARPQPAAPAWQFTTCPVSGFEYWYNEALPRLSPTQSIAGQGSKDGRIAYFTCQRCADQSLPHRKDGRAGFNVAYGCGVQCQVTRKDIDELKRRFADVERDNQGRPPEQWTHDLHYLRRRIGELERQLVDAEAAADPKSAASFTMMRLGWEVGFEVQDEPAGK